MLPLIGPQLLEPVFTQKHGAQVRLGIKVHSNYGDAEVRVHPRKVVDQRCLADTPLVIEESDCSHGFLRMVASTWEGSKANSASGFPFLLKASCARMTPRPNALT